MNIQKVKFAGLILVMFPLVLSCSRAEHSGASQPQAPGLEKQALNYATEYASGKFKSAKKTVLGNEIVIAGENNISYVVKPGNVFSGLIDADTIPDAVISIDRYAGNTPGPSEHLILLSETGKLSLFKAIVSDMRIVRLKDRLISAEIPTHPRSSPLYNCAECKDVVSYRIEGGELVLVE